MDSVERNIAGILGLAGFVVACAAGLGSGNDAVSVMWKALLAMAVCAAVGLVLGKAAHVVAAEHAADHKDRNPVPPSELDDHAPAQPGGEQTAQSSRPSQAA